MPPQLTYPLDTKSKEILRKILAEPGFLRPLAFDLLWKNVYYYSPMYESLDGLSLTGNAPTIDDTGITMATTAVANNISGVIKGSPANAASLSFAKRSAFRVNVTFQVGALTASTGHYMVGPYAANAGVSADFYGFTLAGTALSGSTCNADAGTAATIALVTLSETPNVYELEARHEPGRAVVFYVNGVEKGSLSSTLPFTNSEIGTIVDWEIKTTNTDAKTALVGAYEFMQERYTNV